MINWKTLEYEYNGIKITVDWWAKDFNAKYESKFGTMVYGSHLLYMIPKEYTEAEIRSRCCGPLLCEKFKAAEDYLIAHPDFLPELKKSCPEGFARYDYLREKCKTASLDDLSSTLIRSLVR